MNAIALLLAFTAAAGDLSTIEGRVVDTQGRPVAGAQVFIEQGLTGSLLVTQTGRDGAFRFDDILSGVTGVFARAQGFALDGRTARVAVAETIDDFDIVLRESGILSGTVVAAEGGAVAGARVTRAVLLGANKVSIPFAKLAAYGFEEPRTDDRGRFTIASLPQGEEVALKIAHASFAQEGAAGMTVGDRNVRITLSTGVFVMGSVVARGSGAAVSNAGIHFRDADPPHATAITRSGVDGTFSLRLKPGTYIVEAAGATYRSPNVQQVVITGEYQTQQVTLRVAGTTMLIGYVKDAASGGPVPGARLLLEAYGVPAAITRTGPTGKYQFPAAQGENVVRLDLLPGYLTPPESAVRTTVMSNRPVEIPTFWVAPIPRYVLEVIDANEEPVEGAVVRVLRPEQFGWRTTDANGDVELGFASLPKDGTVVGIVEHPDRPTGALFAITPDRSKDAIVELLPLSRVEGRVVNQSGSGLRGALVEARFRGESFSDVVALWKMVTGDNGAFAWDGATPHVPQMCAVTSRIGDKDGEGYAESEAFMPLADAPVALKDITVDDGVSGRSMLGKRLKWYDRPLLCGALPERGRHTASLPAVVVYCGPEEVAVVAEGLETAKTILDRPGIQFAIVVNGDIRCPEASFPILRGKAPAAATTYLVEANGKVALETFGLPPLFALRALTPAGR